MESEKFLMTDELEKFKKKQEEMMIDLDALNLTVKDLEELN